MTEIEPEKKAFDLKKHITPRGAAKFVVASSVRFVIVSTVTTLVPAESKTDKVRLIVGSYVIASMVADKAKSYISDEIDEFLELKDEFKKAEAELEQTESDVPNP